MAAEDQFPLRCTKCKKQVLWAVSDRSGGPIALDPLPVADGPIMLQETLFPSGKWAIVALWRSPGAEFRGPTYQSHPCERPKDLRDNGSR